MASRLDVTKYVPITFSLRHWSPVSRTPRFFDREALSDVTIKFGEREVKCHKVVLCSASEYFEMMLGVNSAFKERDQRVIELKDDEDLDAVEAMLAYMYTFDYVLRFKSREHDAGFHLNVLVTAKKYLLPKLELKALDEFISAKPRLDDDLDAAVAVMQQHAKYAGQNEYVDRVVTALKKIHLVDLIAKPEYHALLANEDDLLDFVRDRFKLADRADGSQKSDLLFCKNCGITYSCPPSPFIICRVCNYYLIAQGYPTPTVSMKTFWMKEA